MANGTEGGQPAYGSDIGVEHVERHPGAQESFSHGTAHPSQSDEPDLHQSSYGVRPPCETP